MMRMRQRVIRSSNLLCQIFDYLLDEGTPKVNNNCDTMVQKTVHKICTLHEVESFCFACLHVTGMAMPRRVRRNNLCREN